MRKALFAVLVLAIMSFQTQSQILRPVKWSYAAKRTGAHEAVVLIKATIQPGWHLYSQHLPEGGPEKTAFTFSPSPQFSLVGAVQEPKPITKFEKAFDMNLSYFENSVVFQQKIKLKAKQATVKGSVEFMVCDDERCLPPDLVEFSIPVK